MLKPGASIPDFTLATQSGQTVSKASLRGRRFVLYFYPKDSTPACTTQACGIRDAHPDFQKLGVPVFGVSADDVRSHQKFADKQELNFSLLADPDRVLIEGLGVWGEKSLYGRKYMGILRCTFVIDAAGQVEQVFAKVDVKTHAADVLAYLRGDAAPPASTRPTAQAKRASGKPAPKKKAPSKPVSAKKVVAKPFAAKKAAVKAKPVAKKAAGKKAPVGKSVIAKKPAGQSASGKKSTGKR